MHSTPGRQALYHFAAAALIGLTLTALSALLPDLIARQQTLAPQTAGYAILSLLISGGMAGYGYVTAHQAQLVDKVSTLLDQISPDGQQNQLAGPVSLPLSASHTEGNESGLGMAPVPAAGEGTASQEGRS
jgi:hypothetical protein